MSSLTAWDLVGFDGRLPYKDQYEALSIEPGTYGRVRIVGGRTLYEAVDNFGGERVRLAYLTTVEPDGTKRLRPTTRYVDADTPVEFVPDAS